LTGSAPAKRIAVVLLDVLSGGCGVADASRRLDLSTMRYYALETRALQGLLSALEPRPRGRARADAARATAQREQARLEREVLRLQALVRATQRAVAVAPPAKTTKRRSTARGRKVMAHLRAATADTPPAT
jgi:hypothetical protein